MAELGDPDSGEASICCQPDFAPIAYHFYDGEAARPFIEVVRELVSNLSLSAVDQELFLGEVKALLVKLAAGRLLPLHMVKGPMRSETRLDIFELRFRHVFGQELEDEARIRAYHVEPRKLKKHGGSTVIGLNAHIKDTEADDVADEQDTEIKRASDNYYSGKSKGWGL